jgi:ATP-dependent 26S proteasome regulatory subunit
VSSAIVDKYIGESARLIREMFGYAKEHEPCIIFMDEIDAIGGRRFSEGTSADREIQRTLMELLNQLDGFDYLGKTKIIMATNRPDTLDPALLRAGRLDRKIEIPLPNEAGRLEVLKIHAASVVKEGEIDFESVVKMSDGLNGADLRNVVTEAGLFAIKDYRDAVNQDDFNKAVRKVAESKKLEGKLGKWKSFEDCFFGACFANWLFYRVREALKNMRQFCIGWAHYTSSAAIDVRKCKCIIQASISLIHEEALSNLNYPVAVSVSALQ